MVPFADAHTQTAHTNQKSFLSLHVWSAKCSRKHGWHCLESIANTKPPYHLITVLLKH